MKKKRSRNNKMTRLIHDSAKRRYIKQRRHTIKQKKYKLLTTLHIKGGDGDGDEDESSPTCPVCYSTKQELINQQIPLGQMVSCNINDPCNHDICKKCFDMLRLHNNSNKKCPLCNRFVCALKCGDMVYTIANHIDLTEPLNAILAILGPDWSIHEHNSKHVIRYDGRGIALPRHRTWYGVMEPQRYANPCSQAQLHAINQILLPLHLCAQPLIISRGVHILSIQQKVNR